MYSKITYLQTSKDCFQMSSSLSKFIGNLAPVIKIIL